MFSAIQSAATVTATPSMIITMNHAINLIFFSCLMQIELNITEVIYFVLEGGKIREFEKRFADLLSVQNTGSFSVASAYAMNMLNRKLNSATIPRIQCAESPVMTSS